MAHIDRPVPIALLLGVLSMTAEADEFHPQLKNYIDARIVEFSNISAERKTELREVAEYVQRKLGDGQTPRLTFICTHNSRRSHMSQLWAAVAAGFYGFENVETFSGGTEATAFNPRAVAALQRAGMLIESDQLATNPHYSVKFASSGMLQTCFSKVYNEQPNPTEHYCAIMTCSQADEACPIVAGADERIAIPYEDPKVADGTLEEAAKYDERSAQIAREMLYLFSLVKR